MFNQKIYIQLKTNIPLIGSGKISRYYIVKKPQRDRHFAQKKKEIKKIIRSKEITFKSNKANLIFLHWNTKGKPFTNHKMKNTIIASLGISKAYKINKKYSFRDIREAIDLCHDMFKSRWFKFGIDRLGISKIGIDHLTLSDFFKYSNGIRKAIKDNNKQLAEEGIKSWFQECLKGEDYLKEKYTLRLKEKNKRLTRSLKVVWLAYSRDPLSPNDKNALTICSRKAAQFARLNQRLGVSAEGVIMIIDGMINKFHIYKPKHVGYLITDHFWNREIPRELVRYGTVSSIDQNKIKLLPWDKK